MNVPRAWIVWMVIVLTVGAGSVRVRAQEDSSAALHASTLHGEMFIGGQTLNGGADSPTLKEYRDLEGQATIPHMRLKAEDHAGSKFLEFGGTDMTRTDGSYFLSTGRYNAYQFDLTFDRTPHILGVNRSSIFTESRRGRFTLDEDTSDAFGGTDSDAIQSKVNRLLQATDLSLQTDTTNLEIRGLPLPDLALTASYERREKTGSVPFGSVIGSPGGHVVEFAAPRDEVTHQAGLDAEWSRDWYQLHLNYDLSLFRNDIRQLEWDDVASPAFGRASTMPDNSSHTISGSGGFSFPWWSTRLTTMGSYSMMRQNEEFLPFTTVPGFAGNMTDAGTNSADARMNVSLANLSLTSRPLKDVTTKLRYRYYQLDNETPLNTFTDVLNAGDQTPRSAVHSTLPIGFRKQNASSDLSWRINPKVTVKAGYGWEGWDRNHREVKSTNEQIANAALDVRPLQWVLGRLNLSHGVRTFGAGQYTALGGNAISFEGTGLPQFRKFNQADRTRDKADVFLQTTPFDTVTVSGSFFGQQDNYFDTEFGLQESQAYGWSLDTSWAPLPRLNLFAGYAHDDYQSTQQNCHVFVTAEGQRNCEGENTFVASPRDILDTIHTGFKVVAIPERFNVSLSYRYNIGSSKIGSNSAPGGLEAGEPAPVPDITNSFHGINLTGRYRLTSHWIAQVNYIYEKYLEKDFTTDGITPSLADVAVDGFNTSSASDIRSVLLPLQHPNAAIHFVGFSLGYHF